MIAFKRLDMLSFYHETGKFSISIFIVKSFAFQVKLLQLVRTENFEVTIWTITHIKWGNELMWHEASPFAFWVFVDSTFLNRHIQLIMQMSKHLWIFAWVIAIVHSVWLIWLGLTISVSVFYANRSEHRSDVMQTPNDRCPSKQQSYLYLVSCKQKFWNCKEFCFEIVFVHL